MAVPETLLSAEADPSGIEQVAEELPTGGGLEALLALGRRHSVDGTAGGHASRVPVDRVLLEVGDALQVVGDHGQRVARRHEEAAGAWKQLEVKTSKTNSDPKDESFMLKRAALITDEKCLVFLDKTIFEL